MGVIFLAVAAMIGAPGAANGKREVETPGPIVEIVPDRSACDATNTKPVTFSEIAVSYLGDLGQCVKVRGYFRGHALFARKADLSLSDALYAEELKERRIGLYGLSAMPPANSGEEYEAVGIVGDCDQLAGGGEVGGYCHSNDGPYLALTQLTRVR